MRTVQELRGHKDVPTTMIYTHVLSRGWGAVRSPADRLLTAAAPGLAAGPTPVALPVHGRPARDIMTGSASQSRRLLPIVARG